MQTTEFRELDRLENGGNDTSGEDGLAEQEEKEVYIQDIADGSLAASDGRLCLGDVIIQVYYLFELALYAFLRLADLCNTSRTINFFANN